MEPGRTEGIFKHSCEKILRILRINKESIFVIIEAFRYDPIIGWKLTSKGDQIMLNHSPPDTQLEDSILEDERKRNDEKKQRK